MFAIHFEKRFQTWVELAVVVHTFSPSTGRQRHVDPRELETRLLYIASSRPAAAV